MEQKYYALAEATRQFTKTRLTQQQMTFLQGLPYSLTLEREGTRFLLVHALPSDPLRGHCATDADWLREVERHPEDVFLVGHTHEPFVKKLGSKAL